MSNIFYTCGHSKPDDQHIEDTHFNWVCYSCAAEALGGDYEPTPVEPTAEPEDFTASLQDVLNVIHYTMDDIRNDGQELVNMAQQMGMSMDIPTEALHQEADALNIIDLGIRTLMPDPGKRWRDSRNPEDAHLFNDQDIPQDIPSGFGDWASALRKGIQKFKDAEDAGVKPDPCAECGLVFMCNCDE